ncbi:SLC35B2 [Bugula neritina]|uniref:SLC35B2 n=1 Tax=Bugula neritina TaxID=10212 RepID=A0A7J7J7C1_BUGNE|nr:SLC35B2 [Bugula neritina]
MMSSSPILTAVLTLWILCIGSSSADLAEKVMPAGYADSWILRLLMNQLGYATILIPGYFLIQYFRKIKYNETHRDGCAPKVVTMCVFGNPVTPGDKLSEVEEGGPPPKVERSFAQNAALLSFCFVGLQVSYLTWGLLQERIMAHKYTSATNLEGTVYIHSAVSGLCNVPHTVC